MKIDSIKKGAVFSYILIIINTLYGVVFVPFLIFILGEQEYGIYKIIGSLIGSITIFDLGIGSTILRYVAKFRAENKKNSINNFVAMGFIQAGILSLIMVIFCFGIYFNFNNIYDKTLTNLEIEKAKLLIIFFMVLLVINTFEKVVLGVINGCGKFVITSLLKILSILLKMTSCYFLLKIYPNSMYILVIEILITLMIVIAQMIYIYKKLELNIKFEYWDNELFKQSFVYTLLTFIQSIAVQFNGNLDNMVIGMYIGAVAVTVYSVGLQLYNMYEHFAMAFSDLMLPRISKQIAEGASNRELEDTVIQIGRLEFIALGGALSGYLIIGKEFITLWLGDTFTIAWKIGLILMIPTTVPLIQNVCLSILRAKNKMKFRTLMISGMSIFNLILTVFGVPKYGIIAACIGTSVSIIVANIIMMNVYYIKIIHLDIFRIFKNILSRIWICCIGGIILLKIANNFLYGSWSKWLLKVVIFCLFYGVTLFLYGFNTQEKKSINFILKQRRENK